MTDGPMVGEVTAASAVIWARCERPTTLTVERESPRATYHVEVDRASDCTGALRVALDADTRSRWHAWCGARRDSSEREILVSAAPPPAQARAVRFAFGGDIGGQNVCRDRERGYPTFDRIAALQPNFFIGLGDMIYADDPCLAVGRYGNPQLVGPPAAIDLDGFRAHWRYNRADAAQQRLLGATPYLAVWDDHETQNDAGPREDVAAGAPGTHLLPIALRAFLEYQPLIPPAADPTRLYRSLRWGKHVEIFLLDTRQYRDANAAADSGTPAKTMLGSAQLAWLDGALRASDATWKILVASVPLSIPTGAPARDGFASGDSPSGFEHEAARIFAMLRDAGIRNHLWITTDVHFATAFRYRPFADDPQWTSHELITGPLNAGVFAKRDVDPTFRPERLFLYGPEYPLTIASFDEAIGWFNFGLIEVATDGTLTAAVVNGRGERVFEQRLEPADR